MTYNNPGIQQAVLRFSVSVSVERASLMSARESSHSSRSLRQEEDLQPSEALMEPQSSIQIMEDELAAKNMAMEELSRELEEIRAGFGAEGVQQVREG